MNSRRLTPLHRVGLTTDDQKWQVERAGKRALLESEAPSLISVRLGSGSIMKSKSAGLLVSLHSIAPVLHLPDAVGGDQHQCHHAHQCLNPAGLMARP